ncbi:MAG: helix-turn-helix domain-containing protein [Sphingomonas sp.]|nr:helix-turn-helix domain-containing protein [Sphingomonas sp.]
MTVQPQSFTTPDGTEMVVITRADYDRITSLAFSEDSHDLAAAHAALAASDARYPAAVVDAILAGASPLAAWRQHRGLSQQELAQAAGITQTAVSRLERKRNGRFPEGRRTTREAIAVALQVPVSVIEPID